MATSALARPVRRRLIASLRKAECFSGAMSKSLTKFKAQSMFIVNSGNFLKYQRIVTKVCKFFSK